VDALHIHISPDQIAKFTGGPAYVQRLVHFKDHDCAVLAGALYELARSQPDNLSEAHAIMEALIQIIAERHACGSHLKTPQLGRVSLAAILDQMYGFPAVTNHVEDLARLSGLSRARFFRAFRDMTGSTPHAHLVRSRLELAKGAIQSGGKLADIALETGFFDQSHFSNSFRSVLGLSPSAFSEWFEP